MTTFANSRRFRTGAGLITLLGAFAPSAPAFAAENPPSNTTEHVVALSQPAIVSLTDTIRVWLIDEDGQYLNDGDPYATTWTCSGFIVGEDGAIVTAAHCVDTDGAVESAITQFVADASGQWTWTDTGAIMTNDELTRYAREWFSFTGSASDGSLVPEIKVYLSAEAGGGSLPARIIEASPMEGGTDVALVRIDKSGLPTVEVSSERPTVGEAVLSVGYPDSTERVTDIQTAPSFTKGSVTSVRTRADGLVPVYEIDASMTHGMSGGPTLNEDGDVIGLNSFLSQGERADLGFVSPSTLILEMLNRNGIDLSQTGSNLAYHQAIDAYFEGDFAAASEGLTIVVAAEPDNELAKTYLDQANVAATTTETPGSASTGATPEQEAVAVENSPSANPTSATPPAVSSNGNQAPDNSNPSEIIAMMGVPALLVGLGAFALGRSRKSTPAHPAPPAPDAIIDLTVPAPPVRPQRMVV